MERVLHVALQMASALQHLHAQGVVHGDLCPRCGCATARLLDGILPVYFCVVVCVLMPVLLYLSCLYFASMPSACVMAVLRH